MGFFNDLWQGMKIMGGTIESMGEGAFKTLGAAASGFASGGPLGAISAAVPAGISAVGNLIHRIHSYSHPTANDGTATHATIASVISPTGHMKTATNAINSVDSKSPPAVLDVASAGAKFYDGVAKYGDTVAAAKYAGATPISKHIGASLSNAIVGHVKNRIGFDAHNHMRYGASATREAQMLPTTSAFANPIRDFMMNGGAEALAMKRLAMQGGLAVNRDVIIGSG